MQFSTSQMGRHVDFQSLKWSQSKVQEACKFASLAIWQRLETFLTTCTGSATGL